MPYIDNSKYDKIIKNYYNKTHTSIMRTLNRYGVEAQVTRLVPEEKTKLDNYAFVIGKDKMLVNQKTKTSEKTSTFTMRLGILNSGVYNINNPTYEDIEVVYSDDLLKVGDTVNITWRGVSLTYKVEQTPKTYYDVFWQCILSPLKRETQ